MATPKSLPQPFLDTDTEDLQSIETNISVLFNKFIAPIEALRSISKPPLSQVVDKNDIGIPFLNDFQNLEIKNNKPLESRAHAFYRMLGLPVVASDGSFYNPGFDPTGNKTIDKKQAINSKVLNSKLQNIINARENLPLSLKNIFARQDLSSSVYALVLRYTGPFKILDENKQALDIDNQSFTVDSRNTEIVLFASFNDQLADKILNTSSAFTSTVVGQNFSGGQHILRPFIVDPRIENTVMPDKNRICVPFLKDKTTTRLHANTYLMRPGIELIIRDRLQAQTQDKTFLNDVQKIINGDNSPGLTISSLDLETLRSTVIALADQNKLEGTDILNIFNGFTSIQVETVSQLIKLIKVVIKQLYLALQQIDEAKNKINWVPVPAIEGPELGAKGAFLSRLGTNNSSSEIDLKITELRIKKLNSDRLITERQDLGTFASPFSSNLVGEKSKSYDSQLQEEIQKRDRIADTAFQAMGIIEIITGEISGLGLIDILSIYTALWAIDIKSLIGFLDDETFERLVTYNPELKSTALEARGTDILSTLNDFEHKLINILSFADKLLIQQQSSPLEEIGGVI